MKNSLTLILLITTLTLGAQISQTIQVPFPSTVILDPATIDPATLENGFQVVTIDGTAYFKLVLAGGFGGWTHFPPVSIPEEATHFRILSKYEEGTSGIPVEDSYTFFKLFTVKPDWSWIVIGVIIQKNAAGFQKFIFPITEKGDASIIQTAAKIDPDNWDPTKNAILYFSKIEAFNPGPINYFMTFAGEGEYKLIEIQSAINWTINSNQSWLEMDETSGTGNDVIRLTALPNETGSERVATVTVHADGHPDQQIIVTQSVPEYSPNDVAILKTIRDNAPADSPLKTEWAEDTQVGNWSGVYWTETAPKKVFALSLSEKNY